MRALMEKICTTLPESIVLICRHQIKMTKKKCLCEGSVVSKIVLYRK